LSFSYRKILYLVAIVAAQPLAQAISLADNLARTNPALYTLPINFWTAQGEAQAYPDANSCDSQVSAARLQVGNQAAQAPPGIKNEPTFAIGKPGDVVATVQERLGANLAVKATCDRRSLKHLVGSSGERVARESTVAMVTLRAG